MTKVYKLGEGSEVDAPVPTKETRVTANAATQATPDKQWPASGPWHNPFAQETSGRAVPPSQPDHPPPLAGKPTFPPQPKK
jgi:hypothetical protein